MNDYDVFLDTTFTVVYCVFTSLVATIARYKSPGVRQGVTKNYFAEQSTVMQCKTIRVRNKKLVLHTSDGTSIYPETIDASMSLVRRATVVTQPAIYLSNIYVKIYNLLA